MESRTSPYVCPIEACRLPFWSGGMKCSGHPVGHAEIYPVLRENEPAIEANRKVANDE